MFTQTIKLNKKLSEQVKRYAATAGYTGPQEFVEHILEKELARLEEADSNEKLVEKLKGLGYID
jgi:hypothetical protein